MHDIGARLSLVKPATSTLELARQGALSDEQVSQVLRYWLRGLRYQEALTARPKARRANTEPVNPNGLLEPLPLQIATDCAADMPSATASVIQLSTLKNRS